MNIAIMTTAHVSMLIIFLHERGPRLVERDHHVPQLVHGSVLDGAGLGGIRVRVVHCQADKGAIFQSEFLGERVHNVVIAVVLGKFKLNGGRVGLSSLERLGIREERLKLDNLAVLDVLEVGL